MRYTKRMKFIDQREVLSVAEVNGLAKEVLEQMSFWVEGEIYDFKSANSRYYYVYFQLKDESGMILPAIMLPHTFNGLDFDFDNGQKVLAHGKLTLLTKSGKYQFQADKMELFGQGMVAKELEKLKAKLQAEGLLDTERKRLMPRLPHKVGVITSAESDAWADFQRHSVAKFPLIELRLADTYVQGVKAVNGLLRAIELMQRQTDLELLVITRGGGSLEDLAAFNDERVVRAIAASRIPTMVAVGHEKDVSIADLVADIRASTPTNAGQLLTAGYEQAVERLQYQDVFLRRWAWQRLDRIGQDLDQSMRHFTYMRNKYSSLPVKLQSLGGSLHHHYFQLTAQKQSWLQSLRDRLRVDLIDDKLLSIQTLQERLRLASVYVQQRSEHRLTATKRQLDAVSPLAVLQRGYSLVEVNGRIVRSSRSIKQGDTMHIRLHQGGIKGLVTRVEDEYHE